MLRVANAQCRVWNDFAWEMYGEYNDFMSPAAAIMTSDVALAIEEIKRVAEIGFRFLTLPCKPVYGPTDPDPAKLRYPPSQKI